MPRPHRRPLISPARLGALLTLVAWLACAQGAASAGCLSPHIRLGGSWPIGANHPDRLELFDLSATDGASDVPAAPPAAPCNGALCSGDPGVPDSPLRLTPWPPPDPTLPPVVRPPLAPASAVRDSSEARPDLDDSALGLFRPPRASARV